MGVVKEDMQQDDLAEDPRKPDDPLWRPMKGAADKREQDLF